MYLTADDVKLEHELTNAAQKKRALEEGLEVCDECGGTGGPVFGPTHTLVCTKGDEAEERG